MDLSAFQFVVGVFYQRNVPMGNVIKLSPRHNVTPPAGGFKESIPDVSYNNIIRQLADLLKISRQW